MDLAGFQLSGINPEGIDMILSMFSVLTSKSETDNESNKTASTNPHGEGKPDLIQALAQALSKLTDEERKLTAMLFQGLSQVELCSRLNMDSKQLVLKTLQLRTKIKDLLGSQDGFMPSRAKKFIFSLLSR